MKKEGKLVEHETPFGTLSVLKHEGLDDDQAFAVSPINEDRFIKLVDVAIVGGDRSVRALVVSQKTYDDMCRYAAAHNNGSPAKSKEELIKIINNTKHPGAINPMQIDEILIQPEFGYE